MTTTQFFRRGAAVVAVLCCATLSVAVPPGYDRPIPAAELRDELPAPSPAIARPSDNSGDGYVLCVDTTYQFGTFAGTDCWGWQAPNGQEFAIMGVSNGVAFINVTTKQVVQTVTGPVNGCGNTRWRDMKNYGHYLYAVSECTGTNQGLMIINMQNLPTSVSFVKSFVTAGQVTCHNLSIDTAKGYAYLVRAGYDGFRVINLADPVNPVELPFVATPDIHDVFARNDTVWAAEGNSHTFSIWNMANKNSPQLITRVTVPAGGYVHNIWPTSDGRYFATSEETANKTVKFWDMQDPLNIQLVSEYLAPSNLVHNCHFVDNICFMSHYESGVAVVDISNAATPVEIARYDTYLLGETSNFNGTWGVFPHTASGKVYASNLEGKLTVFNGINLNTDNDTLTGSIEFAAPSTQVAIDVSIANDYDVSEIIFPLNWSGPYNMTFDSVSVAGLRTASWQKIKIAEDLPSRRAVWEITGNGAEIPPGSGPVARAYFRLPFNAAGDSNLVTFDPVFLTSAKVSNLCFEFTPSLKSGVVKLPDASCCIGTTGNVDLTGLVDIADVTMLVDYLFISNPTLPCDEEANVDATGNIDIADLTLLVDVLFISNPPLPSCP